jgi:hypothetical protein
MAALKYAEALQVRTGVISLLLRMGKYLLDREQFAEAQELFERALAIGEAAYGPRHRIVWLCTCPMRINKVDLSHTFFVS